MDYSDRIFRNNPERKSIIADRYASMTLNPELMFDDYCMFKFIWYHVDVFAPSFFQFRCIKMMAKLWTHWHSLIVAENIHSISHVIHFFFFKSRSLLSRTGQTNQPFCCLSREPGSLTYLSLNLFSYLPYYAVSNKINEQNIYLYFLKILPTNNKQRKMNVNAEEALARAPTANGKGRWSIQAKQNSGQTK